jgi:hypothetical protein
MGKENQARQECLPNFSLSQILLDLVLYGQRLKGSENRILFPKGGGYLAI